MTLPPWSKDGESEGISVKDQDIPDPDINNDCLLENFSNELIYRMVSWLSPDREVIDIQVHRSVN